VSEIVHLPSGEFVHPFALHPMVVASWRGTPRETFLRLDLE
jgi:hypothetical protein